MYQPPQFKSRDAAIAAELMRRRRSLGEDFAGKMLAGLVGFELDVIDLQCKVKLNQHRPESHAAMLAGYAAGNERERELAGWMERLGLGG